MRLTKAKICTLSVPKYNGRIRYFTVTEKNGIITVSKV